MGTNVFANSMEIACKAASGKSIAAFPDTCLSPPAPPAGPVPLPYPNTAAASDTSNGSTTVMICGEEVMLKDQSVFKTSTGNEAATKSQGMGVVTHTIQGEASFIVWSMDVKFEGANVPRHLDMMAHNEQSSPPNPPPAPYTSSQTVPSTPDCDDAGEAASFADKLTDDDVKESSYVVAGSKFVPADGSTAIGQMSCSGVSRGIIQEAESKAQDNRFFSYGIGKGEKSNVPCSGSPSGRHEYADSFRPKQGHAESKIIESIFGQFNGAPSGKLFLKVAGQPICPDCEALISCARETIEIEIC